MNQPPHKIIVYTCPMHPEIQEERQGMCPECGMSLVESRVARPQDAVREAEPKTHETHAAPDTHAGHSTAIFLKKFWVCLAVSLVVVAYSDLPKEIFSWEAPAFPGSRFVGMLGGTVIFFYGGLVFLQGAWRELRARLPGMMTLIAVAVSAAYIWSVYAEFSGAGHTLFWELATLITIMLLGHWFEMKAVSGAQGALRELSKLLPDTAEVVRGNKIERISLRDLKEGDFVLVLPGAAIPADGVVKEGKSEVDEAMVTGESRPVAKGAGSETVAGTMNGDGSLTIEVTKIGDHTFLAGVMRLVAEAQASKSRLQLLADRAALYLTVAAIGGGAITFALWMRADAELSFAMERLVAVLVIACPHALGLAVPLVASISTTLAARTGFLVKQRLALEAARSVEIVLFDKTGTLTEGNYGVTDIVVQQSTGVSEETLVRLAASVDQHSEHFAARAIVAASRSKGISLVPARDFERLPGMGAQARIGGEVVAVGGEALLGARAIAVPHNLAPRVQELASQGKTIVYVVLGGQLAGALALADVIREESREAVRALKTAGVKTAMITGDAEQVAQWVAGELGIDEYFARVLPGEKAEKVKILQKQGLKVAMVGDGINDAPALMQADVGIAIGVGTNVAIGSAGIILVRNDPRDIARIIRLSRLTYNKMIQNLFWATGYNIIALPMAAGVLSSRGIILEPAFAALLMSLSTVIVALNAMLLKRTRLS